MKTITRNNRSKHSMTGHHIKAPLVLHRTLYKTIAEA